MLTTSNRKRSGSTPGPARVVVRRVHEQAALLTVDPLLRTPEVGAAAGLHFDAGQVLAVPAQQVDLAAARARAVVARDDLVPPSAQVVVCQILASPRIAQVLRKVAVGGRAQLCQQGADHVA